MPKSIYLTEQENAALEHFADGKSPRAVRRAIGIPESPNYAMSLFCDSLRKKTGITDIQDPQQVQAYLASQPAVQPILSPDQLIVLHDILDSTTYASTLRRRPELRELRASTLSLIGIRATDQRHIRTQVRTWMMLHGRAQEGVARPALTPLHLDVIRAIAMGGNPENIAHRATIYDACLRAGILSPGRGARKRLAQLFIAAHDQRERHESTKQETCQEEVAANDPMF